MNFPRYIALVYSHISRDLDLFIILKWTEDLTAYAVNIGLPWIESDLCFIISSITPSALHFTVVRPFVLGQYLKVASMSYSRGRLSSLLRSCVGLPHPVDDESVASVGDVGPPPVVRPVEVVERVAVRALAVPSHPPTVTPIQKYRARLKLLKGFGKVGEFCTCCCLPLLPELACSIHATWP